MSQTVEDSYRSRDGCGPGAAARAVAHHIGDGHGHAIDRLLSAIRQAEAASKREISAGRLTVRQVAIEGFELHPDEAAFDLAFAIRVGALDGRHPELQREAHRRIREALVPGGRLYIDGGDPLRQITL